MATKQIATLFEQFFAGRIAQLKHADYLPDRSIYKFRGCDLSESDLDSNVLVLGAVVGSPVRKHMPDSRDAFLQIDNDSGNKLSGCSNQLMQMQWARNESTKFNHLWQYTLRRCTPRRSPDGKYRQSFTMNSAVMRLKAVYDLQRSANQREPEEPQCAALEWPPPCLRDLFPCDGFDDGAMDEEQVLITATAKSTAIARITTSVFKSTA